MLAEVVTVQTATATTDAYGNAELSWTSPRTRAIPAAINPIATTETVNEVRDATATRWLMLTNDLTVTSANRIVWNADTFEVDGLPLILRTPRGAHHLETTLRRVVG